MDLNTFFQHKYDECIKLLAQVVSCESLSGQEEECIKVLENYLTKHGIQYFEDSRGSIAAISMPGDQQFGSIKEAVSAARKQGLTVTAYNAHSDVVAADEKSNWLSDPFVLTKRGSNLYGRGTCDMKGALAAMAASLVFMKELDKERNRKQAVIGCFVIEEEVAEGLAFKNLFEEFDFRPDQVILGEPSNMEIARGQRGKLEMTVETTGIASHTSVPETADNAAYKMARALLAIEQYELEERQKWGLRKETTLQRTTIVGSGIEVYPESKSFVPDKAIIHVTCRLALGVDKAAVVKRLSQNPLWPETKIESLVYRGKSYKGKSAEWVSEHKGWETKKDSDLFKRAVSAYNSSIKEEPEDKIWPFSTDGVYCAGRLNIPTLGIGPGREDMAHKDNEYVSEENMFKALKFYTLFPYY